MKKQMDKNPNNNEEEISLPSRQRKLRYLKARRNLRRLEITMARARSFARVAAAVLLFWGLIKLVNLPQWYLNENIFNGYHNPYLQIEGNDIISDKQVLKQIENIKLPRKPLYLLNIRPVEKAILKLAPVKKVYVRRFWFPARLKIVIDEKTPILAISPSPKVDPIAVFTEDTTIIGKDFLPLPESKKIYTVLTYDDYTKWSNRHVNYLIYLSKLIEGYTKKPLLHLDIRNPNDVFAQLNDVRLRLGELDRTVFIRTKRIADVLDEALKIKEDIDYIDLRWNKTISIKLKNTERESLDDEESESGNKTKEKSKPVDSNASKQEVKPKEATPKNIKPKEKTEKPKDTSVTTLAPDQGINNTSAND